MIRSSYPPSHILLFSRGAASLAPITRPSPSSIQSTPSFTHSTLRPAVNTLHLLPPFQPREGLLKVLKGLPPFAELSFPQLERLCAASLEQTYAGKEMVIDCSVKPEGFEAKQWLVW